MLNAAVEWDFHPHFGINFPVYGSFWNYGSQYTKFRVLMLQPELRAIFLDRIFVGLHAGFAFYNVSMSNWDFRYQDTDGRRPLWNIGIAVGYRMPFKPDCRWGFEVSIGFGYANMLSDRYYNVPNGKYIDTLHKNYWGIDQLNFSITYKIF